MPTRSANASWGGSLQDGHGQVTTDSGAVHATYSFPSRFESGDGTNPEELLGASHAGCFAMALTLLLGNQGYTPQNVDCDASVTIEEVGGKPTISKIELAVRGQVPGIDDATFQSLVKETEELCPISRALAGTTITVQASLSG